MLLIGSHVSYKANDYLVGSVNETLENKASCLMIFTGPPQNFLRKDIDKKNVDEANSILNSHLISSDNIIIHAPYLMNLASPDLTKRKFAIDFLTNEVKRTSMLHAKYIVLHPGNYLTQALNEAISLIAIGINEVFKNTSNLDVCICLETMAGKGTEVGSKLNEIKSIIDLIDDKKRIGVCLDTCHLHESGYDIRNVNDFYNLLDKEIGCDYIKVIHLNDSKNEIGAKKDRHENIGYGKIGFDVLYNWVWFDKFKNIPKILETPYYEGFSPYKNEIEMLKEKKWVDWRSSIK